MLNDQSILDARKLITGKDGQLFITSRKGNNIFLAEVDDFSAQISVNNSDYQPIGSSLSYAVNTGYSITLTLTEAVIRDDVMISEIIADLQEGYFPSYDFQGKLRRRDGGSERMVWRHCVPDGSIDLMKITPGEVIKRAWNLRVNCPTELLEAFAY